MSQASIVKAPASRRLLALGGLWVAVSGAVVLAPGCYGRNCEGDTQTFGADTGQGEMIDDTTWESNAPKGTWLPFPRQRYYIFDIRALGGRTPEMVVPYLAAQPDTNSGGNYTIGAGNLALLMNPGANRIDVKNDTCSDYFLRLVVTVPPVPPITPVDGGTAVTAQTADASVSDAGAAEGGIP